METLANVLLYGTGDAVDLTIADGRIVDVTPATDGGEPQIVLPGLVDMHVHFRDPAAPGSVQSLAENLESGARASAAGGFTEVFAMANTEPVTDTPSRWEDMRRRSIDLGVGVHPVSSLTEGLGGDRLVDLEGMRAAGALLFSDDGRCLDDHGLAREAMARLAAVGGIYAEHAQDSTIAGDGVIDASVARSLGVPGWPTAGEASIVERDIQLAADTGCRVHVCHVSTRESLGLIRAAKASGLSVTAEVTPHHLVLTAEDARRTGPALKVNPPLRSTADRDALRAALLDGTIDVVATDHAPHAAVLKDRDWTHAAFGLTGVETALAVVAHVVEEERGAVDWQTVATLMSTTPRALTGLPVVSLTVGDEASLCVVAEDDVTVDPTRHVSLSRNSPFVGWKLGHRIVDTHRRGRQTWSGCD